MWSSSKGYLMQDHDIVYILKNNYVSDELKYSLRSVCKNFPYRKIWFYGGKPDRIQPDEMVEVVQTGSDKWQKVNNTLRQICQNDDITPDFWLFNDDFFVMKKLDDLQPMVGGTLWARAQKIASKHNGNDSKYSKQLRDTARILRDAGCDRLDYALHVPMLINREKGLKTLVTFPNSPMFRSLYGNHHKIGGVLTEDVKIQDLVEVPKGNETFLSTNDDSFKNGRVGAFVRTAFPDPCKYELNE